MAWSTRELAQLAGTTINTIRHYHALGLIQEPERRVNGYKQYTAEHLVALLHVRRLTELGVPLARVPAAAADGVDESLLRELDDELRADIGRLRRARADVAALRRAGAPIDAPRGFEEVAADLSIADRAFLHMCTRLRSPGELATIAAGIAAEPAAVRAAFDALVPDADGRARRRLAAAMARSGIPWRAVPEAGVGAGALAEAAFALYNPAQRATVARAVELHALGVVVVDDVALGA